MYKEDLKYLTDDFFSQTIARGLAELYQAKPKHPVDFLAKWLLCFSEKEKNKKKQSNNEEITEKEVKEYIYFLQNNKKCSEDSKCSKTVNLVLNNFLNAEYKEDYIEESYLKSLCEYLGFQGMQVWDYSYPIKEFDWVTEHDREAHLLKDLAMVFRLEASNRNTEVILKECSKKFRS